MFASTLFSLSIYRLLPTEFSRPWRILTFFIEFFLAGYIFYIIILATDIDLPLQLIVGLIFLMGAIFVFAFIRLTKKTLLKLHNSEQLLRESNEQLEIRVKTRTKELLDSSGKLDQALSETTQILDTAASGIRVIGTDYIIKKTNRTFLFMVGLPKNEVIGKKCYEVFNGPICKGPECPLERIMASPQTIRYETDKVRLDGKKIPCLITAAPFVGKDGRLIGIVEDFMDVTEQKKAEDILRQQESFYRLLNEKAPVGYQSLDVDGRMISINETWLDTMNYEREDVVGKYFGDFLHPESIDVFKENFPKFIEEGGTTGQEFTMLKQDGTPINILLNGRVVYDSKGNFEQTHCMFLDITELLETKKEKDLLQTRLIQAQKLEAVGQLAAGIAHEINTPTQYIESNIDFLGDAFEDISGLMAHYHILLDSAKQGSISQELTETANNALEEADWEYLNEEVPAAVSQAREGTQRVTTIVRAMKEFSHPSSKEKVPSDLIRIITNTTTVCQNEWKNIADLETDFATDMPSIPCIADEIGQVILNIMVNAAHAISENLGDNNEGKKGTIQITVRTIGENAEILIKDSGSGIPEDIQKQIFDPFFTTKEVGQGSGQGLAIAHDVIVNKHGGSINIESTLDKGTTFIIQLPLVAEQNSG